MSSQTVSFLKYIFFQVGRIPDSENGYHACF